MNFPVLYKPYRSTGSQECHDISIIFDRENLRDFEGPCLIEEFKNHDGQLIKIYVLGNDVNRILFIR